MSSDLPHAVIDSPEGVERLKQRDQEAWKLLLESYSGPLRRDITVSLVKRGLSEQSLDDILQETWLVAVNQIECFIWQKENALYHWLRVISLNRIRKRTPKAHQGSVSFGVGVVPVTMHASGSSLDRFLGLGATVEGPEYRLSLLDDVKEVVHVLNEQSERDQEIITRWLLGEEKPQELASLLGMKPGTISQIIWRFLKRTRTLLKPDE